MWFSGSIVDVITKSKTERKVFLVFVEGEDDASTKMNDVYGTLKDQMQTMNIVAIKIKNGSQEGKQFAQFYPIIVVPSTYLIDNNGVPIEIIGGFVDVAQFKGKIENALKLHENQLSKAQSADSQDQPEAKTESEIEGAAAATSSNEEPQNESESQQGSSSPSTKDKVERAQQLLEELRQKKVKEDEEKERQSEIDRRNMSKELLKAKRDREEKEQREIMLERQRAKQEERMARQRVLAQIAQDKAERKARLEGKTEPAPQAAPAPVPTQAPASVSNATVARIQFRLPDGSTVVNQFEATATLASVREFLNPRLSNSQYRLSTSFPRRTFTDNENQSTLKELGLVPSTVLSLFGHGANSDGNTASINIRDNSGATIPPGRTPGAPKSDNANLRRRIDTSGNVARLRPDDDDDENNTWNGNSTQQM